VRTLLALSDDSQGDCASIDAIAHTHVTKVERKLADPTALRRELKSVITSCNGGGFADCRIIEALAPVRR